MVYSETSGLDFPSINPYRQLKTVSPRDSKVHISCSGKIDCYTMSLPSYITSSSTTYETGFTLYSILSSPTINTQTSSKPSPISITAFEFINSTIASTRPTSNTNKTTLANSTSSLPTIGPPPSPLTPGAKAGLSIGILLLFSLIVAAIFFFIRRHRQNTLSTRQNHVVDLADTPFMRRELEGDNMHPELKAERGLGVGDAVVSEWRSAGRGDEIVGSNKRLSPEAEEEMRWLKKEEERIAKRKKELEGSAGRKK
ncbi:hypothetical protein G7Y89_g8381 [Cudoniella acicularis]|uniref:Uncharacterized protein n=1 Tax=Cudoniella acicularis TaxID=354080 RepID=A0A8H4RGQ8_9HELO|nr:hypothetical protein G7Y89_g8381 [Cudoniella acicularis]